jgi:hypothetical protein
MSTQKKKILGIRQWWLQNVGDPLRKTKKLALKPRSSLQGGGNISPSLIEPAEEFIDDEVDIVASRFTQLTLVSREKMCSPSPAFTI